MKDQDVKISKVLEELRKTNLEIVLKGEKKYYYARQISNTRFGAMPDFIVFCKTPQDVQICINTSRINNYPFRIRSGGHQHEGMSSGNGLMIIDLSYIYNKEIEYIDKNNAWIPVGKQLQEVYNELEKRGQIIPGGGCQSVNLGGLTQGGGWGTSIRKFGLTCDNITEAEIVLANGDLITTSAKKEPNLFWALKGGGGGNFGVVTRFKFKLSSLGDYKTSFAILWRDEKDVCNAVKKWIDMHLLDFKSNESLDHNLSCTVSLSVNSANDKNNKCKSAVYARMGGMFYGTKNNLLALLNKYFNSLLPLDEHGNPEFEDKNENYFVRLEEVKNIKPKYTEDKKETKFHNKALSKKESEVFFGQITLEKQFISEFMNPVITPLQVINSVSSNSNRLLKHVSNSTNCDRGYHVIPNAPSSTCDQPHPHKVTSGYPKKEIDHHALVDKIYKGLLETKYYDDVNKYMVWHCFGGVVLNKENNGAYPFRGKPYLLQLQCWWDDSGRLNDDIGRNKEYVNWVNTFRKKYFAAETDGAFINFVDKNIISIKPELDTIDKKLALLKYYYSDNLKKLREVKSSYDPNNLFNFKMSIPPLK